MKATGAPQRSPQPSRALVVEKPVPGPSLQALTDEQHRAEMERQQLGNRIETVNNRVESHEARCEEHYTGIRADMADLKGTVTKVVDKVDILLTNQASNAAVAAAAITNGRPKWWHQLIGGAVIALIGWMGSTIWSMETAKVDALQRQPAAAVTVNPPAAVQPAPAISQQMIPPSAPPAPADPAD